MKTPFKRDSLAKNKTTNFKIYGGQRKLVAFWNYHFPLETTFLYRFRLIINNNWVYIEIEFLVGSESQILNSVYFP